MSYLLIDHESGTEWISFDKPVWSTPMDSYDSDLRIELPKGSIERLLGRKISWKDPVEFNELLPLFNIPTYSDDENTLYYLGKVYIAEEVEESIGYYCDTCDCEKDCFPNTKCDDIIRKDRRNVRWKKQC